MDAYQLPVWETKRRTGFWREDSELGFACASLGWWCLSEWGGQVLTRPQGSSLVNRVIYFSPW